jgi:hypothetical protein
MVSRLNVGEIEFISKKRLKFDDGIEIKNKIKINDDGDLEELDITDTENFNGLVFKRRNVKDDINDADIVKKIHPSSFSDDSFMRFNFVLENVIKWNGVKLCFTIQNNTNNNYLQLDTGLHNFIESVFVSIDGKNVFYEEDYNKLHQMLHVINYTKPVIDKDQGIFSKNDEFILNTQAIGFPDDIFNPGNIVRDIFKDIIIKDGKIINKFVNAVEVEIPIKLSYFGNFTNMVGPNLNTEMVNKNIEIGIKMSKNALFVPIFKARINDLVDMSIKNTDMDNIYKYKRIREYIDENLKKISQVEDIRFTDVFERKEFTTNVGNNITDNIKNYLKKLVYTKEEKTKNFKSIVRNENTEIDDIDYLKQIIGIGNQITNYSTYFDNEITNSLYKHVKNKNNLGAFLKVEIENFSDIKGQIEGDNSNSSTKFYTKFQKELTDGKIVKRVGIFQDTFVPENVEAIIFKFKSSDNSNKHIGRILIRNRTQFSELNEILNSSEIFTKTEDILYVDEDPSFPFSKFEFNNIQIVKSNGVNGIINYELENEKVKALKDIRNPFFDVYVSNKGIDDDYIKDQNVVFPSLVIISNNVSNPSLIYKNVQQVNVKLNDKILSIFDHIDNLASLVNKINPEVMQISDVKVLNKIGQGDNEKKYEKFILFLLLLDKKKVIELLNSGWDFFEFYENSNFMKKFNFAKIFEKSFKNDMPLFGDEIDVIIQASNLYNNNYVNIMGYSKTINDFNEAYGNYASIKNKGLFNCLKDIIKVIESVDIKLSKDVTIENNLLKLNKYNLEEGGIDLQDIERMIELNLIEYKSETDKIIGNNERYSFFEGKVISENIVNDNESKFSKILNYLKNSIGKIIGSDEKKKTINIYDVIVDFMKRNTNYLSTKSEILQNYLSRIDENNPEVNLPKKIFEIVFEGIVFDVYSLVVDLEIDQDKKNNIKKMIISFLKNIYRYENVTALLHLFDFLLRIVYVSDIKDEQLGRLNEQMFMYFDKFLKRGYASDEFLGVYNTVENFEKKMNDLKEKLENSEKNVASKENIIQSEYEFLLLSNQTPSKTKKNIKLDYSIINPFLKIEMVSLNTQPLPLNVNQFKLQVLMSNSLLSNDSNNIFKLSNNQNSALLFTFKNVDAFLSPVYRKSTFVNVPFKQIKFLLNESILFDYGVDCDSSGDSINLIGELCEIFDIPLAVMTTSGLINPLNYSFRYGTTEYAALKFEGKETDQLINLNGSINTKFKFIFDYEKEILPMFILPLNLPKIKKLLKIDTVNTVKIMFDNSQSLKHDYLMTVYSY